MKYKRLGLTDLKISTIGLGTWAIGGGNWVYSWGKQDDKDSINTIARAFELGINWIDTAPAYGLGHSEEIIGRAMKELGAQPIISTKCGLVWNDQKKISPQLDKMSIIQEVDESLKRLKIDVIDLYQIHWPRPDDQIEEAWETIMQLKEIGKIKYGGVCNFNVEQIKRLEPTHPVESLQPPYSMLETGIEEDILPYCGSKEMGVIVYSPMQKGILTGKVNKDWIGKLSADDHRRYDNHFKEPLLSANMIFTECAKVIAEKNNLTLAQLAIAWTLSRKEVTAAIVGARRPEQIEETAVAGSKTLSKSDLFEIDRMLCSRESALLDL